MDPTTDSASVPSNQVKQESLQQEEEDQELPPTVNEGNIEDGDEDFDSNDRLPAQEESMNGFENDESQDIGAKEDSVDADVDADADADVDADVDADANEEAEPSAYVDTDVYSMRSHKNSSGDVTRKKKIRKSAAEGRAPQTEAQVPFNGDGESYENDQIDYSNEDPATRKRRLLEEKMDLAVKNRTVKRRKADEDDLERMQDDKIDFLKNKMIEAANLDVEKNSQGQIASEKFKLLREVMDTLNKADLAISILDNNLLEAVRLWLEPLPDASMPSYQIQKELLQSLTSLPVKTDHLVASGIGKVLVFYQRSKRTEPTLKKIVDKLISEWTRPILNKSDSYKDRTIKFNDYNKSKYTNQLSSTKKNKNVEPKSLYEQQAERRNRAAIPSARTTAYKIAPKVDSSLLMRQQRGGEMFSRINRKMTNSRKKVVKKSGPSIEGKHLSM